MLSPDQCAELTGQVKDATLKEELQRLARCTVDQWKAQLLEQVLDKGSSVASKGVEEYKRIQEEAMEELERRVASYTAAKEALAAGAETLEAIKGK
ncbi:hypothetical protein EV182_006545, partial [Spiromyces aspiralis]